jgi:hypothetical protein
MALITDPDLLEDSATDNGSQEVYINVAAKTIKLVQVGNLSTDGVTLKCLYSFLKEEWRNDPNSKNLAAYPFPMVPITDEAFELVDGWDFNADATRYLIRTAGWTVKNTSSNVTQRWAGIVGLGTIESNDQLYFQQASGGASTNVVLTGQINQAVQIFRDDDGDGNTGEGSDFDIRTFFKLFVREFQQTYDDANLTDIGVTTLESQAYRFPISTGSDALKITNSDGTVGGANNPYQHIKIRYFSGAYTKDVDTPGTGRNFGIVIEVGTHSGIDGSATASGNSLSSAAGGIPTDGTYDGGTLTVHEGTNKGTYTIGTIVSATAVPITTTFPATESTASFTLQRASPIVATAEQIYEKVQYFLRQNSNINSATGSITGKTADLLLNFVGDTLRCGGFIPTNPQSGGTGVIIEGFAASDTNRIQFIDNSETQRTYPFVASLALNFGDNLIADGSAKYWVYFTRTHRKTGTDLAITSASGITATLTSSSTDLTEIANGEEFLVSGFANAGNNGLYRATGAGSGTSKPVTKVDPNASSFTNESAGPTVNLDMNPVGSANAIIVDDNGGADIAGNVGGAPSVSKSFNYDGNVQGGRTASTDALVTVIGIGLATGQYVKTTGTIARSTSNSLSLVAPLERNYANA